MSRIIEAVNISAIMGIAIPILIFILILGIVVFIHELGHYLAAKRAGVFVEEFAIGMGPKLFYFTGKKEQVTIQNPKPEQLPADHVEEPGQEYAYVEEQATIYSLRLFPIGGFCKMRGLDDESDENDSRALNNKTVPQRMLVMAGGSIMNFLLAFVLFFVLVFLTGYQTAEIIRLQENSPAHLAGLQIGDRITHINGARVTLYENFMLQLEFSAGEPMYIRINRSGEIIRKEITPMQDTRGNWRLGFIPDFRRGLIDPPFPADMYRRVGLWGATTNAAEMMLFNIRLPFTMLARWINNQHMPAGAGVMGPIGMAGEVTQIYQHTIQQGISVTITTMLFFTALLSAALGLMNLLPIPAMDGARLVFLFIEGIRRKPINPEKEGMVHMAGFVLIIGLAIFIAYRDIVRLLPGS